jgi:flagellar secretion chaperone FliS
VNAAARYQKTRETTLTPGELLLELYAGLFRFLEGAKLALEGGDRAGASQQISKAHAIVSELLIALDHSIAPELCQNLAALYDFCLDRLTTANVRGDLVSVEEVIRVLRPLHEAWKLAVPKAIHELANAERARSLAASPPELGR